jgi:hypothetical protein
MFVPQGREAEGIVCARILLVADTEKRVGKQMNHSREYLFPRQVWTSQNLPNLRAQVGEGLSEGNHSIRRELTGLPSRRRGLWGVNRTATS